MVSASGGQGACSPVSICPWEPHEASLGGPHWSLLRVCLCSACRKLLCNKRGFYCQVSLQKKKSNVKCIRSSVAPSDRLPLEAAAARRQGPWWEGAAPGGGPGAASWELAASCVWIWAVATRGGRGWVRPADSPECCLQVRDLSPQTQEKKQSDPARQNLPYK